MSTLTYVGNNLANKFKNAMSEDEQRIVCDSVFITINWFIELVNAFSSLLTAECGENDETSLGSDIADLMPKLVARLGHIYDLKKVLANLLPYMKSYRAPLAVFGLIDSNVEEIAYASALIKVKEPFGGLAKKKTSKRKSLPAANKNRKKRPKKEAEDEENDENSNIVGGSNDEEDNSLVNDEADEDVESDKENAIGATGVDSGVDMEKLSIHFREFDMTVIDFVNLEIELAEFVPDTGSTPDPNVKLKPHLFQMIISDFNQKLALVLKSSAIRASPTGFGPAALSALSAAKPSKMNLFMSHNPTDPLDLVIFLLQNYFKIFLSAQLTIKFPYMVL